MSYSINDSITQGLQSLGSKMNTVRNGALRSGRDYFAEELQKNTPLENVSDRSWKAQREMDKIHKTHTVLKHMRDDIVYSGVDQFGNTHVGFGKDTYWRVHFVELGTIHQHAQPFISNTVAMTKDGYQQIVKNELKKGLGL